MKDVLGNKLDAGNLVCWHLNDFAKARGLIAEIAAVVEPAIVGKDGATQVLPHLVLKVVVQVQVGPRGEEPTLQDFMRLVSPQQEALITDAMAATPRGRTQ